MAHYTGLTPPHLIEVYVPSQKSDELCICLSVSILPLSMIVRLGIGTVLTVWCFLFSNFIIS